MKRTVLSVLLAIALTSVRADECETRNNEIPLEKIQGMFAKMKSQSKWDTLAPLVWGYFFFDPNQAKLSELSKRLSASGYKTVELFFNGKSFTLHLEKIEAHTPESLNQRNIEFGALAKAQCVRSYDGFDVGPVTKG